MSLGPPHFAVELPQQGEPPQRREWGETIDELIADLDRLNHSTEEDFLRIGGKLGEFFEGVNRIRSELAELTGLVSPQHGIHTAEALSGALDRLLQMKACNAERSTALGRMRQDTVQLGQALSGFQGTVSNIRTLGFLTRIEIARLGSAGADFGSLANDVRVLATNVQTKVVSVIETARMLLPPIEAATQNISALEAGQTASLPAVISGVLARLSSFREIEDKAHLSSVRLEAQFEAISKAFTKLIVSIQFHDITRQQVEHVIEVLRSVQTQPNKDENRMALALQSFQLADAAEKFAGSVTSLSHNLQQIATHVMEASRECRSMFVQSKDDTKSFFLQMEQGCTTIVDSLSHCDDAETDAGITGATLTETIGQMRDAVEAILPLEIQMRHMAINARVSAVHLGPAGDALGVLADAMQQDARCSRSRCNSLIDKLDSMSEMANRLFGQVRLEPVATIQHSHLELMRQAIADMHESGEQSRMRIGQIIAAANRLSEELSAARDDLSVGVQFAETTARVRDVLQTIGAAGHDDGAPGSVEAFQQSLAELSKRYTMQSERDVHQGVMAAALPAVAAEKPEPTDGGGDELGDNVELF